MADVYAAGKIAVYLKEKYEYVDFTLLCGSVVSIGYLSGFQNLFNVCTRSWDGYYTEIRFGLDPRPRDTHVSVGRFSPFRVGLKELVLCQEKVQIKYALLMLSYPAKASALSSNAA